MLTDESFAEYAKKVREIILRGRHKASRGVACLNNK